MSSKTYSFIVVGFLSIFIISCSKNGSDNDGTDNFNATHYKIENISTEHSGRQLIVYYTIKNISTINKSVHFNIIWKVKGTDGAIYEDVQPAPTILNAGASNQQTAYINLGTDANNPVLSTLSYTMKSE